MSRICKADRLVVEELVYSRQREQDGQSHRTVSMRDVFTLTELKIAWSLTCEGQGVMELELEQWEVLVQGHHSRCSE